MKALTKKLDWLRNALWLVEGMALSSLLTALRYETNWWLPLIHLVINSLALWNWRRVATMFKKQ